MPHARRSAHQIRMSWLHVVASVLAAVTIVCSVVALAEVITLTTSYPSPRGVYQELRTTSNTFLATQQGSVAIGMDQTSPSFDPTSKLNVAGTMRTDALRLIPTEVVPSAAEGLLYFDPTDGLRFFWGSAWQKIPTMKETSIASATLSGTYYIKTKSGGQLGDSTYDILSFKVTPPQKGLYNLSWSAQVKIDAEKGCVAQVGGGHTRTDKNKIILVDEQTVVNDEGTPDNDDDKKNGHYDTVSVEGAALIVFKIVEYRFWLSGYETCDSSKIDAQVLPGATLQLDQIALF